MIGDRPYLLTLGGHDFYWFSVEPLAAREPGAAPQRPRAGADLVHERRRAALRRGAPLPRGGAPGLSRRARMDDQRGRRRTDRRGGAPPARGRPWRHAPGPHACCTSTTRRASPRRSSCRCSCSPRGRRFRQARSRARSSRISRSAARRGPRARRRASCSSRRRARRRGASFSRPPHEARRTPVSPARSPRGSWLARRSTA